MVKTGRIAKQLATITIGNKFNTELSLLTHAKKKEYSNLNQSVNQSINQSIKTIYFGY